MISPLFCYCEPFDFPLSPVPCTPTNISVSVDCSQDTARFNWTTSIGAIFYIAVAEDANGNVHSCNSMGTNCLMEDLRCGQNYTASIIGTNLKCNSTASEEVTFMTGRSEGWVTLKLDRFMIVSLGRRERDTRFVLTVNSGYSSPTFYKHMSIYQSQIHID